MKTLDLMNVKEDDVLNRNEMKGIMAGSGSTCYCNHNGCAVHIDQSASGWEMIMQCSGDSGPSRYSGNGQYGGSACGGECP